MPDLDMARLREIEKLAITTQGQDSAAYFVADRMAASDLLAALPTLLDVYEAAQEWKRQADKPVEEHEWSSWMEAVDNLRRALAEEPNGD